MNNEEHNNIIFFDGLCNLCNGFIDFVIKRDKKREIKYTSLQSAFAIEFLKKNNIKIDTVNLGTIYFFSDGIIYDKSTAVLKVVRHFGGGYSFFSKLFLILNKRLRNVFYNLIAKNRYIFFGKKDTCRMPTNEERKQFLD